MTLVTLAGFSLVPRTIVPTAPNMVEKTLLKLRLVTLGPLPTNGQRVHVDLQVELLALHSMVPASAALILIFTIHCVVKQKIINLKNPLHPLMIPTTTVKPYKYRCKPPDNAQHLGPDGPYPSNGTPLGNLLSLVTSAILTYKEERPRVIMTNTRTCTPYLTSWNYPKTTLSK